MLKAHCQTKLTCALKNLKGCIPDSEKRRFHSQGLHRPIAALNVAIKTDLVVVDGMCGDLTFEEGGNPVPMNRIMVGYDPVLIDAYGAELIGLNPHSIKYITLAEEYGAGSTDVDKAEIIELGHRQAGQPILASLWPTGYLVTLTRDPLALFVMAASSTPLPGCRMKVFKSPLQEKSKN